MKEEKLDEDRYVFISGKPYFHEEMFSLLEDGDQFVEFDGDSVRTKEGESFRTIIKCSGFDQALRCLG